MPGKDHVDASTAKLSAYAIVTYDPDNIWDVVQRSTTSAQAGWPKGYGVRTSPESIALRCEL